MRKELVSTSDAIESYIEQCMKRIDEAVTGNPVPASGVVRNMMEEIAACNRLLGVSRGEPVTVVPARFLK